MSQYGLIEVYVSGWRSLFHFVHMVLGVNSSLYLAPPWISSGL
jgi:hypothetical protein